MTFALCALIVAGLLEAGATWWLVRGLRRLDKVDDRLSHLTEALRLLAETTEAGFRASAQELARQAEHPVPAAVNAPPTPAAAPVAAKARPRTRRVAAPAPRKTRGADNRHAPEASEGELRLRRHLVETGTARAAAGKETGRSTARA